MNGLYLGHVEVLKVLVACAPNPNDPEDDHGNTPIHLAADFGHLEVLKVLLTCTDSPNIPNDDGQTPLMLANFQIHKCHGEVIEILKKYPEVGFI